MGMSRISSSSQFTCAICGQGFEQKSRFERHMETSHPPTILDLLNRIPEKQYSNMADVEREAAKVL